MQRPSVQIQSRSLSKHRSFFPPDAKEPTRKSAPLLTVLNHMRMEMHALMAAALAALLGIHAQRQAAATGLRLVARTRHVAVAVGDLGAADERVAAEALPAVLGAGERPARVLAGAVRGAVRARHAAADGRVRDAGEGPGGQRVRVAADVGPAGGERDGR